MAHPPSLDAMRLELLRQGLPAQYVERVIGEWSDHLEDLSSADVRQETLFSKEAEMPQTKLVAFLGTEEELTAAAVGQYRARTFAGRHPIWTFLVAPIPLLLACWISFYGLMALAFSMSGDYLFDKESPRAHAAMQMLFESSLLAPPVVAILILGWWARRSGQVRGWFAAACGLIAFLAACHHANLVLPVGRGKGAMSVGFGIGGSMRFEQLVLPLLAGGLLIWRMGRNTRTPDNSPESSPGEPIRQAA